MANKKRQMTNRNERKRRPNWGKHVSKVDKEIKEIKLLNTKIEEWRALEESEKTQTKKFSDLAISNYTKQGRVASLFGK